MKQADHTITNDVPNCQYAICTMTLCCAVWSAVLGQRRHLGLQYTPSPVPAAVRSAMRVAFVASNAAELAAPASKAACKPFICCSTRPMCSCSSNTQTKHTQSILTSSMITSASLKLSVLYSYM
jgi:hypothetical protein